MSDNTTRDKDNKDKAKSPPLTPVPAPVPASVPLTPVPAPVPFAENDVKITVNASGTDDALAQREKLKGSLDKLTAPPVAPVSIRLKAHVSVGNVHLPPNGDFVRFDADGVSDPVTQETADAVVGFIPGYAIHVPAAGVDEWQESGA